MANHTTCKHLENFEVKYEPGFVCEKCVETGDDWVHLRTCQTCGATLCCDSSPNRHTSKHAMETGHPIAISAEPDEYWAWCYIDEEDISY